MVTSSFVCARGRQYSTRAAALLSPFHVYVLASFPQEWQVFTDAIDNANNEGVPEHMESASSLLTQVRRACGVA